MNTSLFVELSILGTREKDSCSLSHIPQEVTFQVRTSECAAAILTSGQLTKLVVSTNSFAGNLHPCRVLVFTQDFSEPIRNYGKLVSSMRKKMLRAAKRKPVFSEIFDEEESTLTRRSPYGV